MESPTLRPKRDRRQQIRIPPTEIARRAYHLYLQRGGEGGHDVHDWLQPERELLTTPLTIRSSGFRTRLGLSQAECATMSLRGFRRR